MRNRILAVLCLVAVLASFMVAPAAVSAETTSYKVGYAIKDMNPDYNGELVAIQLTGNGNDSSRVCTGKMDDNGDGKTDANDGLFITCTAVTDQWNTTVLYITMDTLQAYSKAVTDIRAAVVKALGSNVISKDRIMISGSHTHSGPSLDNLKASSDATWKAYYNYIISQATAAAKEAYADRAPATMTRGSIDATTATANLGYTNKDNYNNGKGYRMNFVRHYNVTATYQGWFSSSTVSYVADNTRNKAVGKKTGISDISNYKITSSSHTAEADNTMHVLQFAFDEDSGKDPIVLVNWRAHATQNSSVDKYKVSSDFINALRYNLQGAGYRAAFLQGAAANATISSHVLTDWKYNVDDADATNTYGKLLAEIALYCLKNSMTKALSPDPIRTVQYAFHGEKQEDSDGLKAAAEYLTDYYNDNGAYPAFPYAYTYNGESYIINSSYHVSNITTRSTKPAGNSHYTQEINVISLGGNVVFVTAPNELSDRYDGDASVADEDNDWLKLVGDTYGTPFVIGYANGRSGYLPSTLNYIYNTDEYYKLTGKGKDGENYLGAGVYEANVSRYAKGVGETLIDQFDSMIDSVVTRTAPCDACDGAEVEWKRLTSADAELKTLGSGHYYMVQDLPRSNSAQKTIASGETLCLDLNGHSIDTTGRTFNIKSGGTLNIMDSKGGGLVTSYTGSNNVSGGTITVAGELNLYGGTLGFVKQEASGEKIKGCGKGGVVALSGAMNMYGGTIVGADMVVSDYLTSDINGCGGAIFVSDAGTLNISGGTITSGTVPDGCAGPCVFAENANSRILLSGNANVEEIAFDDIGGSSLTVSGAYTGTTALQFNTANITLADGLDIGTGTDADLTGAKISCVNGSNYGVVVSGTNLNLTMAKTSSVAAVYGATGAVYYDTLQAAVNAYSAGYIKLIKDANETVSISKNVYLDLNGYDISQVNVSSGCTLYCMDSQTDDYIADDYGKISSVSGEVLGVPMDSDLAEDGYLKVTESDGVSFHRVNLKLTEINLRAVVDGVCTPSVYYTSNFMGDEKVKAAVKQFGVALSVQEMPNETNIENTEICQRSKFEGSSFQAGPNGNSTNSTLLKGIMKPTNTSVVNKRNANLGIFGRAYLITNDGQYLFGTGAGLTLKWVSEEADDLWSKLDADEQESLVTMYETYTSIVGQWDMTNTSTAATES